MQNFRALSHLLGAPEHSATQEVYELLELRRRLTETEARYLLRSGQLLTAEQAMALLGTVVQVIKKCVSDAATLTQLAHELRLLGAAGATNFSGGRD